MSNLSYELTQTSPLVVFQQLFHSKLKTLLYNNSYHNNNNIHPLPIPPSTPNTVHHSLLTICMPDSVDLDFLRVDFWLSVSAYMNKLIPATSLLVSAVEI